MIADASVSQSACFPDDDQVQARALIRDQVIGRVELAAPTLLLYQVTNAVVQARRRGRISDEQAETALSSFEGLGIALRQVTWQQALPLALCYE